MNIIKDALKMILRLVLWLVLVVEVALCDVCKPPSGSPSCVCDTPQGRIDLSSIGNKGGKARFSGSSFVDPNGYEYLYNPCYAFSFGSSGCSSDTSACQIERADSSIQYQCGAASSEQFIVERSGSTYNYTLEYDVGDGGRETIVYLFCDESAHTPRTTTVGDSLPNSHFTYIFYLYSRCACPGKCGGGSKAGAIGLVLIFMTLGAVAAYFIVGILINKFHLKKTGNDLIPQKEFWFALPFMIKEGCVFTFSPIIKLIKKDSNSDYEKL